MTCTTHHHACECREQKVRELVEALEKYRDHVLGCVHAAYAEGLGERLRDEINEIGSLRDLVERRLLFVADTSIVDQALANYRNEGGGE